MPKLSVAARFGSLLRIHREIDACRYPNATTLARLLEVSTKTARNYVHLLDDAFGIEPTYDAVRHGYRYAGDARLPVAPKLTDDEVIAIFLLEEAARSVGDSAIQDVLESALAKLSLMIPPGRNIALDDFAHALSLRLERAPAAPQADPRMIETLYRAVIRGRRLRVVYRGRHRRRTTRRTIDPLHLTRCEGQWYLVAHCHLRNAIRTFVPARMSSVDMLDEGFESPVGFDPQQHFSTAFGIVSAHHVAPITLRFDSHVAPIIRERVWHATQRIVDLDRNAVRLTMTCSHGDELFAWLLSWGEHVVVEAPAALGREVAAAHRRAARISSSSKVVRS